MNSHHKNDQKMFRFRQINELRDVRFQELITL